MRGKLERQLGQRAQGFADARNLFKESRQTPLATLIAQVLGFTTNLLEVDDLAAEAWD